MKNKKVLLIFVSIIFIVFYYILIKIDVLENNIISNILMYLILVMDLVLLLLKENKNIKNNDKLFSLIINNSDTIYIMLNLKNKKTVYISNNVEEVLGIKKKNNIDDLTLDILNIPEIKKELSNWDEENNYVSPMIEYKNSMWIRIKLFKYIEGKNDYVIINIVDSTKEHDRQHLLITQAGDIKTRENALNQIIEKTYDFEININLINDICNLKYFKKDRLYLGEERRSTYSTKLDSFLGYVNEKDRDAFYKELNLETLKDHFNKYELDSIVLRYRVGNEIKGNSWLESTIFFLTNKGKNTVSILTKNVTDSAESIREQNILLQNALMEAKKSSKMKTELMSTISKNIRTPLTNIVGISDALLLEKLDNSLKDDIKNINNSSNDILKTVDGLLDSSKVEKKTLEQEEGNYSIYKMFKKVENTVKEFLESKQLKLNINLDNNLPVVLYGNYRRITEAIVELVNNSIKNTKDGEINILVKGEKISNDFRLSVEVYDTGSGISEEKLNEIMNSNSTGISNVKNLMNLLDGTFEIESKEGKYTKATIKFIQKIVEDNKVREMITNNKNAEIVDLTGKKVLVVDDNLLNLKVSKRLLSPYNLDITLISSGEECIDKIKEQNDFDLIFMDQMMPGLDGISTMKKLKELDNFNIPIVVLTADAMNGQKEKYLSSGFDDYISKPIQKKELTRVLKKFIK